MLVTELEGAKIRPMSRPRAESPRELLNQTQRRWRRR